LNYVSLANEGEADVLAGNCRVPGLIQLVGTLPTYFDKRFVEVLVIRRPFKLGGFNRELTVPAANACFHHRAAAVFDVMGYGLVIVDIQPSSRAFVS
jgi:hypothetical protein